MLLKLLLISYVLPHILAQRSIGKCQFTRDCQVYPICQGIQDASCVCNFGQCRISGNPFFRGSECNRYTDCGCRNNPSSCFCKGGFCKEEQWECHKAGDCSKLAKCKGKNCACSGNLCEFECSNDADCKNFHCNRALGYQCKCESNLCAYKEKKKECSNISECVRSGKCSATSPCACTQGYCTLPWWVRENNKSINCRNDKDCNDILLSCKGNKCSCQNMRNINDFEQRGSCKLRKKQAVRNNDRVVFRRRNRNNRVVFQ